MLDDPSHQFQNCMPAMITSRPLGRIQWGTIMFHGDKSIASGYHPKVFLHESAAGSHDIPKDVSVRQSLAVFPLMGDPVTPSLFSLTLFSHSMHSSSYKRFRKMERERERERGVRKELIIIK